MSDKIDKLAKGIRDAITESADRKPSPYDTQATVLSKEGDILWVHIPGGVDRTPVRRTVDADKGDKVMVRVSDGRAWTIGNMTNPPTDGRLAEKAYRQSMSVSDRFGNLSEFVTDNARIVNADIENVKIKNVEMENVMAQNARITNSFIDGLTAEGSEIRNSKIEGFTVIDGVVQGLQADRADIYGRLTASEAVIESLDANYAHITNGVIDNAQIGYADVNNLDAHYAHITDGVIDNATISYADVNNLNAHFAHIDNGIIDNATIGYADVDDLDAHYAEIDLANVNNAWIEYGAMKKAEVFDENVFDLSGDHATIRRIDASKINVANLRADNLVVRRINGQPVVGGYTLIDSNSSGYASKNPQALGWYEFVNAQWVLSTDTTVDMTKAYYQTGNEVSLYDQAYIDGLENDLQQQIDGAVETFTGSVVPTLVNWPYTDWYDTSVTPVHDERAKHVGDIYYVVNSASNENGYCYRFAYDNTSHAYSWVLIKDSDVTKALSDISELQTFESTTTSWIDETDEGLETIRTNHTTLAGVVDKTVKESVQLWFTKSNTTAPNKPTAEVTSTSTAGNAWRKVVPAYNASYPNYYYCWQYKFVDGTFGWSDVVRDIAMGETQGTSRDAKNTADAALPASTFTSFESTTFKDVKDTVTEHSTKFTNMTSRLGLNSDGTGANTDIVAKESALEQTVDGISTRVGKTETKLIGMYATSSTAAGTAAKVATITPALPSGATWELSTGTIITVKFTNANTTSSPTLNVNSKGAKAIKTYANGNLSEAEYKWAAGSTFTFVYNGTNWLMQDSSVSVRMNSAETGITQNAEAITLEAAKREASVNLLLDSDAPSLNKVYASENRYWSDTSVTAVTPSLVEISDPPAQGIAHAARFVCDGTNTSDVQRAHAFYNGYDNIIPLIAGQTYTATWWARCTSGSGQTRCNMSGKGGTNNFNGPIYDLTSEWKMFSSTMTVVEPNTNYNRIWFSSRFLANTAGTVEICGCKLIAGDSIEVYKTTIEQTADNVLIKATRTSATTAEQQAGGTSAAALINVAPDTVKIAANHVEIDGTATFNAIKSSADAAYDSKGSASAVQTNLDNLEIGGRNLLLDSGSMATWGKNNGATITDGVATFPTVTANTWREVWNTNNLPYSYIRNKTVTFSCKVKASSGTSCALNFNLAVVSSATSTSRLKYRNNIKEFTGTGKWETLYAVIDITDSYFSTAGSGTPDFDTCYFLVRPGAVNTYWNGFDVKEFKLEVGNRATDWSPAPEDSLDQEQYIYKQAVNGTTSMTGTTTWVTATTESVTTGTPPDSATGLTPVWTTKRPSYQKNYPVLFVAKQTKTVGGLVTCTTPLIDDTTTIIDGGKIITGSVTANKLDVSDINASNSLTIGALSTSTQDDILNSNIEIGGRNLLRGTGNVVIASSMANGSWANAQFYKSGTGTLESVSYSNPLSFSSVIKATATAANTNIGFAQSAVPVAKKTVTLSAWVKGTAGDVVRLNCMYSDTAGEEEDGTKAFTIADGDWHRYELSYTPTYDHSGGIRAGYVYGRSATASRVFYICGVKLEYGNKPTDWTPAPEDIEADTVEYIVGTQTEATNVWTGVSKSTSLYTGKRISYKLPYAGNSSAATLNLTLADGTTTGAKNVYRNSNNSANQTVTTQFGAGSVVDLIYDGTNWRSSGYDIDSVQRTKYEVNLVAAAAITNGRIICGTASGYRNIAPSTSSSSITFSLDYPLLYAATAIAAGATSGTRNNNYLTYQNINFSNNGTITSGTAGKMIYLKGTVSGRTFTISTSPCMTTVVPSSDDGLYYIPLGVMSSTTNGYFESSKDVYGFRNGSFHKIDTVSEYITYISANDGIKVHNAGDTTNYAKLNSDGMTVYQGGTNVANFGTSCRIGTASGRRVEVNSNGTSVIYDSNNYTYIGSGWMGVYANGDSVASFDQNTCRIGSSDYFHVIIDGSNTSLRFGYSSVTTGTIYSGSGSDSGLIIEGAQVALKTSDNTSWLGLYDDYDLVIGSSTHNITINGPNIVLQGPVFNSWASENTVSVLPNIYMDSYNRFRLTTNTSSERYKNHIGELKNNDLDPHKLYDVEVVQFKYNTDVLTDKTDSRYDKELIGFIAEQVKEHYPIAVDLNEQGECESWNAQYMIPPMLALIQEQHKELEQLKTEVNNLKGAMQ